MNFLNKSLFVISFGVLGSLTACTSCSKTNTVDPPKPVPAPSATVAPLPTTQVISVHNATVTVPIAFEDQNFDNIPDYHLLANKTNKEMIELNAENFNSSYEEYVLEAIRALKNRNVIVHSAEPTMVNNQKFTLVESTSENVVAYFWITAKDGYGYTFTCGGLETSTTLKDMCVGLVNSLQIQ